MTVVKDVTLPDTALLSPQQRATAARRVKLTGDIDPWPELSWFNSAPCARHDRLTPLCLQCGVRLRRHQRLGATWLYLAGQGLLADTVGSGKTAQVCAVLAMAKEKGELSLDNRAVIVCQAAATGQWLEEVRRMLPGIPALAANGPREQRVMTYLGPWEIAIVSDRTFAPARSKKAVNGHRKVDREGDVEILREFPVGILVFDDIDAMRNHATRTAWAVNRLAADCTRVIGCHGTPLQKRLTELHSFLGPVGGRDALGTRTRFHQRYVTQTKTWIWVADKSDPAGRRRVRKAIWTDSGIQEDRIPEFRELIEPMILRRTAADLDDVELPAIQVNPVAIELNPRQKARYEELRQGVLRRLKRSGEEEISYTEAAAAFTRGWQICSGLAALDDGQDDSAKLDWTMDRITGDLAEDKAVAFVYFRPNVQALSGRLDRAGIGHVLLWSGETDPQVRQSRLARFREDPACRVLVGTTTIERSLNLQAARHLIAVDTILNPARMEQILGRVRRQGSAHPTVFFHHLLARGTQEDGYLALLRREAAVADAVWDEKNEVWEVLSPRALLNLVATGSA